MIDSFIDRAIIERDKFLVQRKQKKHKPLKDGNSQGLTPDQTRDQVPSDDLDDLDIPIKDCGKNPHCDNSEPQQDLQNSP